MFPCNINAIRMTCLSLFVTLLFTAVARGDDPPVRFDVPALKSVHEVPIADLHGLSPMQKIVEVVIPVTTEIQSSDRNNVQEFRFDVFWNRNVYPICDYAPKTQTASEIEGLISVDQSTERNATLGLNLQSGYQDVVKGSAQAGLGTRKSLNRHYQEIPQHEVLVASGTIKRGTGAFFRFHPSRTEILEGGRDLVVAFQVPQSWRGGVLQIECHAAGHRKVLGAWKDSFEVSRAFILPIYLEGDDQARKAATEFVRSEQRLMLHWQKHQRQPEPEKLQQFQFLFGSSNPRKNSPKNLPKNWVHYLIQSGDVYFEKYQDRLPVDVADAAGHFVQARADLLSMGR